MARSFQVDAVLLALSRSTIAESRRLLASSWSERVNGRQDFLLANSRASVADSKRLLAALEAATAATHSGETPHVSLTMPTTPATVRAAMDPAALSVHVFADGARFGWIVSSPSEQILGRGTAATELKARVDAFCAGMVYLDWAKDRSPPDAAGLH